MALGFDVTLYRQAENRMAPASVDSARAEALVAWRTGWSGLRWIDELASAGEAVLLARSGYPTVFTVRSGAVAAPLSGGPPGARRVWAKVAADVGAGLRADHAGIEEALAACDPDEWLVVVAWDES